MKSLFYKWSFMILFQIIFDSCRGTEFHTEQVGVAFLPYAKVVPDGQDPVDWNSYTFENIKTMLTVISGKFSKVLALPVADYHDTYKYNQTYYQGQRASIFAPEAAALINKEKQNLTLSMLRGIYIYEDNQQMGVEVMLAIESTLKANMIFSDTVTGLVFDYANSIIELKQTLKSLQFIRSRSKNLGWKLGSYQICTFSLIQEKVDEMDALRYQIVLASDFVICIAQSSVNISSVRHSFFEVAAQMGMYRPALKRINPSLKVACVTGWASKGSNDWETLENMKIYWEMVNNWANKMNFPTYLQEAFDVAHFNGSGMGHSNMGWWRLKENAQIDSVDGYIEKISVPTLTTSHAKIRNTTKCIVNGTLPLNYSSTASAVTGTTHGNYFVFTILSLFSFWMQ